MGYDRNKKRICKNCNNLRVPCTKDLCYSCRTKERKLTEPFYLEKSRLVSRNSYRRKMGYDLNSPTDFDQSREKIFVSKINQCINFLLDNGYEVRKK